MPRRRGYAHFVIYNRGGADQHVSLRMVKWTSFPRTEVAYDVGPTLVRPTDAVYIPFFAAEFDGTRWWARIRVTSDDLVPSVEFRIQNDPTSLLSIREVRYFGPEDFKKFTLRFRPGGEAPEPDDVVVAAARIQAAAYQDPLPGGLAPESTSSA